MSETTAAGPRPTSGSSPGAPDTVLTVAGVSRHFGAVQAVRGLSLEVRSGEVFGLLGPNGAGKTTTIRMICGELAPDEGHILLHGRRPLAGRPAPG